jgi:hypothetical protein
LAAFLSSAAATGWDFATQADIALDVLLAA